MLILVVGTMIKLNFKTKLFLLVIFTFTFSLILSINAAATMDVITYGTSDNANTVVQTTPAASESTISLVTSSSNVVINKYSSDYSFSLGATTQNPMVCICSDMYDKIYITNKAPYEATFTISTSLPEFVTVPYSTLKLQPGSTAEVNLLIAAACNANKETLDYNILVANNFGTQYTIERQLLIDRCQSISSTLYASTNKINPCESVNYTVELKNTATFTENYIVKPKNAQFFDNKQYEVTLDANKKAYMNFTYSPDCSIYGNKENEFTVESVNNKLTAKLIHDLTINKAYDFTVSNDENISLCRDKELTIPIKVKNLAGFSNDFTFNIINKQDFINSQLQTVTIKSGEEYTFLVTANPDSKTKTEQVLEFEIKTKLGDMDYRGQINLKTNDCYAIDVKIQSENNPTLCSGTYTYNVIVKNNGLFEERVLLSGSSNYSEVFPSTVILGPEESANVTLTLSLPDSNVNKLPFTVVASTTSQPKTWQDSFFVNVNKKRDCTLLAFDKQRLYARYGTENVTFKVQNKGSLEESYFINYDGSSLIELKTNEITLKPGESKDIVLKILADKSEKQNKYGFKITALSGSDETYENNMVLKMTDIPFVQKLYTKITSTVCTTVTSILLLLILLGLILIIILACKRVRVPLALKLIAVGLIILIIIIVLVINGFPHSRYPPINKAAINNSNLVWYQDHTYKLDLNKYFFDPDNDTLTFSVEDTPENLTIKIEGSNVFFIPDKNWFGNARVRFVAEDPDGATVTSDRINLNVIEVPAFSWIDFYFKNCLYINALLLIIFFALIFLLRTRKEKEPMTRKILMSGIKKEKGFLYFVDKDGDVAKAPMARSNKKNQKFTKQKVGKVVGIKKRK
jgi:uncharacterized membrane protein